MSIPPTGSKFLGAVLLFSSCCGAPVQAEGRPFTANDLVTLVRVSGPRVAPDGQRIVFERRTTDLPANKGVPSVWMLEDAQSHELMADASSPQWSPDGQTIFALSGRSGKDQVWETPANGGAARQVTDLPLDVLAFRVSGDGRTLVVALAIARGCKTPDCSAERLRQQKTKGKASGETFDTLFVRHWDAWADGSRNRLFALSLDGGKATPVPLTPDLDGDVPSKPFGGPDDFAISPDGRSVYFSARIAGRREPWSTNFDIWRVPIDGTSEPADLTAANPAWDADPVVSPDGKTLAYRAQRRPGFESDRFGVWMMDLKTGAKREVTPKWDRSVDHLAWSVDGRSLFVTAEDFGARKLFRMDVESGGMTALTKTGHVGDYDAGPSGVVLARDAFTSPADLWKIDGGAAPIQLTHVNDERLAGLSLSTAESFSFPGWNGETVHGNVFKPFGYQAGHKYPVAFLIHGGPQGAWDDAWSYRWNPETYTGAGYAVVMIDFHGSTGYGQAFTDSISGHWGDRPLEDLQKGWAAALARFPWLDGGRAAALGASYGGYMINWIAGVWNAPWKCLVVHDGVFDQRMMGYASDEMWFTEWENGHAMPWKNPEGFERFNPVDHVAQWTKPLLVIHGGKDFRIPIEQGLAAFGAAQSRDVPSRLLYFPDENHWVLKPQNSLQWNATVLAWLNQWLAQ